MVHKLAVTIIENFIRYGVGEADDAEIYVYGIELMIEKFITHTVLVILALHFKLLIPSALFMVFFILLRGYTGGYHANTFIGCFIGTVGMYLACSRVVVPLILSELNERIPLLLGLTITVTVILILSPVNHPCLDMNSDEIKKCKNGTKAVLAIETVFILGGVIWGIENVYIIFPLLGMAMCAVMLVIAKIIKQEVKVNEEKF